MKKLLILALLMQSCTDDDITVGNLNNISSAYMNSCGFSDKTKEQNCIFLSNSFNNEIKVFNPNSRTYAISPSGYFNLIIPNDGYISKITSYSEDAEYVYCLDKTNNSIKIIHTNNLDHKFKSSDIFLGDTGIEQVKIPEDLVVYKDEENNIWLFVSYSKDNLIEIIKLDNNNNITSKNIINFELNIKPFTIKFDQTNKLLFIIDSNDNSVYYNIINFDKLGDLGEFIQINDSIGKAQELFLSGNNLFTLNQAEKKIYMFIFDKNLNFKLHGFIESIEMPSIVYYSNKNLQNPVMVFYTSGKIKNYSIDNFSKRYKENKLDKRKT